MQNETIQATSNKLTEPFKQAGYGKKFAVGLLPFSPVSFTGPDAMIAWARLIGYSAIAYYTFSKKRSLSYIAMSCAGLSLASSLTAGYFGKVADNVAEQVTDPKNWKPVR